MAYLVISILFALHTKTLYYIYYGALEDALNFCCEIVARELGRGVN